MATYNNGNSSQSYTVPSGVDTVKVRVWGAGGGDGGNTADSSPGAGGNGGYVRFYLSVSGGDTISMDLGAGGGDGGDAGNTAGGSGGNSPANNGGAGGDSGYDGEAGGGGGGGGETVVRYNGGVMARIDGGGGGAGAAFYQSNGGFWMGGAGGGGGAAGGSGGSGHNYQDSQDGNNAQGSGNGGNGGSYEGGQYESWQGGPGGSGGQTIVSSTPYSTSTSTGSGNGGNAQVAIDPSPTPVTNFSAISDGTTVDLSWDDSSYENGYYVHRSTTSGFSPSSSNRIASLGSNNTSYTDSNATIGVKHYYIVRAYNGIGSKESTQESAVPAFLFSIYQNSQWVNGVVYFYNGTDWVSPSNIQTYQSGSWQNY